MAAEGAQAARKLMRRIVSPLGTRDAKPPSFRMARTTSGYPTRRRAVAFQTPGVRSRRGSMPAISMPAMTMERGPTVPPMESMAPIRTEGRETRHRNRKRPIRMEMMFTLQRSFFREKDFSPLTRKRR